ncbi:MAG: hypothetical protein AB7K36_30950 [Chloroflexota bacterium]
MLHIQIATSPSDTGLEVQYRQDGGTHEGEQTWSLERNQWGLVVGIPTVDCLSTITSRIASQCIFPYALRERLQESVYGQKAVRIEIDTDAKPVACVRVNGRQVR